MSTRTTGPAARTPVFSPATSALLMIGSVAFVLNLSVATHEFGHWILDRLYGLEAGIVLDPIGGSHIDLREPFPDDLIGWPDAAGPLLNVLVGVLLFALLWRKRSPWLLPLLMWAPIALLQESTTVLVQLSTREPGTDFVRLVQAGVPEWSLVAVGLVGFLTGFIGLVALLPIAGIPPTAPFGSRAWVLGMGLTTYSALVLLVAFLFDVGQTAITRNTMLFSFVLLLSLVAAAAYPRLVSLLRSEIEGVPRRASSLALALGGLVAVLSLLALN